MAGGDSSFVGSCLVNGVTGGQVSYTADIPEAALGRTYEFTVRLSATRDGVALATQPSQPSSFTVENSFAVLETLDRQSVGFNPDDTDGDGILNLLDVDDDGDGLIEISTPADLHAMRNNLRGTGFERTTSGNADDSIAGGETLGCGGSFHLSPTEPVTQISQLYRIIANGITPAINSCRGYELANDISFAGLNYMTLHGRDDTSAWLPIGSCSSDKLGDCMPDNPMANNVGGLVGYGADASGGNNLIIHNVTIAAPESSIIGGDYVGGLVGHAGAGTVINSSSAQTFSISGGNDVGGLVGDGQGSMISSNYARVNSIIGSSTAGSTGGLVGDGQNGARLSSSYAEVGSMTGMGNNFGGLVGVVAGSGGSISSSYAQVDNIMAGAVVGGLVGAEVNSVNIRNTYALSINLTSTTSNQVDGLLGNRRFGSVSYSFWLSGIIYDWLDESRGFTFSRAESGAGTETDLDGLQTPTNANAGASGSIYENWVGDTCADGSTAWDFGGTDDLPALTCFPTYNITAQRAAQAAFLLRRDN